MQSNILVLFVAPLMLAKAGSRIKRKIQTWYSLSNMFYYYYHYFLIIASPEEMNLNQTSIWVMFQIFVERLFQFRWKNGWCKKAFLISDHQVSLPFQPWLHNTNRFCSDFLTLKIYLAPQVNRIGSLDMCASVMPFSPFHLFCWWYVSQ